MVDTAMPNERDYQDRIMATFPEDDTGVLAAENQLYEALRQIQNLQESGDRDDLLAAEYAIMEAYFKLHAVVEDGEDCPFLSE